MFFFFGTKAPDLINGPHCISMLKAVPKTKIKINLPGSSALLPGNFSFLEQPSELIHRCSRGRGRQCIIVFVRILMEPFPYKMIQTIYYIYTCVLLFYEQAWDL